MKIFNIIELSAICRVKDSDIRRPFGTITDGLRQPQDVWCCLMRGKGGLVRPTFDDDETDAAVTVVVQELARQPASAWPSRIAPGHWAWLLASASFSPPKR